MKQWTLAWRSLARRPVFVAVVVGILTLGIGMNTALFSVVDAVLLRPLPYSNPDRVVKVMEASPSKDEPVSLIAPARLAGRSDRWRAVIRRDQLQFLGQAIPPVAGRHRPAADFRWRQIHDRRSDAEGVCRPRR